MKIEKVNGLYRKKRITPNSKVPFWLWISVVLALSAGIFVVAYETSILQSSQIPELNLARKHSYKIVAVGDIACPPDDVNFNDGQGVSGACQQKQIARSIVAEKPDGVLLLGDVQYERGVFEDFERSFIPDWRNITAPIFSAAGNHDYGQGNLSGYKKAFDQYMPNVTYQKEGKTYYDFNFGQWQFYALDSNCQYVGGCEENSEQTNWLTSKVISQDNQCSIAFWHHPVFTSGQHNTQPDTSYGQAFWDILAKNNVDIVLNGHDHDYERFAPKGVSGESAESGTREFVIGTGGRNLRDFGANILSGSEFRDNKHFGYLVMTLYPGRYDWEFKGIDSVVYDNGTSLCQ
ncbi:metallophosphoesterase [Candidatus Saccharibacteria bacterium]|nr:metallophosphoesterase [Candidatus Saccharibacteria bacterium]